MINSACCFTRMTIKLRKFGRTPLSRLRLSFRNYYSMTTARASSILWILFIISISDFWFARFWRKLLLKSVFYFCYTVSIVSNLSFPFSYFFEFKFLFQWPSWMVLQSFLRCQNWTNAFVLFSNCLRVSIVERSIILIKHFFKNIF